MANGDGVDVGNIVHKSAAYGGVGLSVVVVLLVTNLGNETKTALDVAAQHGQEFIAVRQEVANLRASLETMRLEMLNRTQDRFTGADARKIEDDVDSLDDRLRLLENAAAR